MSFVLIFTSKELAMFPRFVFSTIVRPSSTHALHENRGSAAAPKSWSGEGRYYRHLFEIIDILEKNSKRDATLYAVCVIIGPKKNYLHQYYIIILYAVLRGRTVFITIWIDVAGFPIDFIQNAYSLNTSSVVHSNNRHDFSTTTDRGNNICWL